MKKILHITTDNKFISHALTSFENVYPGQNIVWMFANGHDGNVTKNHRDLNFSFKDTFKPSFLKQLANFDLVIIHGMDILKYPLIALAPREVKFSWLGWGYDYYGYIYQNEDDLLLKDSLKFKNICCQKSFKAYLNPIKILIKVIKPAVVKAFKKKALARIGSISPVLPIEHTLLKKSGLIPSLPNLVPWNYGSLEESLVKNFINQRVSGNAVLVGNCATFTNNHLEIFDLLNELPMVEPFKLIAPLSYGDDCCLETVVAKGKQCFGERFQSVTDFMVIDEYVALLKQCGFAVMNHKRQQAVGNIVIMLYLGARVFLRDENPVYQMFKEEGGVLNSVEELKEQPELLQTPLSEKEIETNIAILYKHWSKKAIDQKTKNLVEFHLGGGA